MQLDNRLQLGQVFNYLYYLYDEKAQEEIRVNRNNKPTIRLVFMKHLYGKMPYEKKDKAKEAS